MAAVDPNGDTVDMLLPLPATEDAFTAIVADVPLAAVFAAVALEGIRVPSQAEGADVRGRFLL